MANTNTLYRKANVSSADALAQLAKRFPGDEVVSFEKRAVTSSEVKAAGTPEGELVYVATIRVAEFPPSDGGEEKSEDSGDESSAPAPPKSEDSGSSDEGGESESSDSDSDDAPFGGEGGEGDKPEKPNFEDALLHLLTQIADALTGGDLPGGPGDDLGGPGGPPGGPGDLDLPDVGAPDKGEGLPPPGGPGGPGGKPLPPPVKEKSPVGVGAFASVAGQKTAYLVREADAGNKAIIREVEEFLPTHRVAKIQRTGSAKLNGSVVSLPDTGKVVVTLVSK